MFNQNEPEENVLEKYGRNIIEEVKKGKTYSFRAIALVDDEDTLKIDHYKIKSIELGK